MAKKSVFWGMLALALTVSFAVVGCGDPLQEGGKVKIDYDTVSSVDEVTAVLNDAKTAVIISWEAAEDGSDYTVYAKVDGKKPIVPTGASASFTTVYKKDGTTDTGTDPDKWNARVFVGALPDDSKSYSFGIQTVSPLPATQSSDIVWSTAIAVK